MLLADAHLDLAWNATRRGRDVTRPAAGQPFVDNETATVGLPDLTAGGVGLVCGTLFAEPHEDARAAASEQLDYYDALEASGHIQIARSRADLAGPGLRLVVLMEGADAIAGPDDVRHWFGRGVRVVGLAWRATRHAAGTGGDGPLSDLGRATVPALDAAGMIHDVSHLAERALDELLDLAAGPVCATHSNCRALVGRDPAGRHLPDRQIAAIVARGGVVGINLLDKFLLPAGSDRRATPEDWAAHVRRVCDLAGDARSVGLGSDLDGGFGRERCPVGIETAADLPRLADALAPHLGDAQIAGVMGGNWRRFFAEHLPDAPVSS